MNSEILSKLRKMSVVDWLLVIVGLLGVTICIWSLYRGITAGNQVQIEYINDDKTASNEAVTIDVGGGVISPGVYELPSGSRIKDALVAAGGYSQAADRKYIEVMVNLADKLVDGQKIYFPVVGATTPSQGYGEAKSGGNRVNINSATVQELDTLWGIGEAKANDIISNRPYKNVEELVEKKIVSKSVLDRNKSVLSVY